MTAKPVPEHISDELMAELIQRSTRDRDQFQLSSRSWAMHNGYVLALTELQHRREAEAGISDGWVLVPREPTEGMVDAHYDAHAKSDTVFASAQEVWSAMLASAPKPNHIGGRLICEALGFDPTNHHNAAKCPYCTPDAASPSSPASGVRVKALRWVPYNDGVRAKSILRGIYAVLHDGDDPDEWSARYDGRVLGYHRSQSDGEAACQSHFDAAILSALGEHP